MSKTDISALILIGLHNPKYYKRSVWNSATKIMEFLCDNTTEVIRNNGERKYVTKNSTISVNQVNNLADKYIKSL